MGGTNDVNYKYYNGHMAVDHQLDTNTRFVDRCQSENMESSSTGYRRWSGVVCCPNSSKPSSPYCDRSTFFWSVPIVIPMSSVNWHPSWQHIHAHCRVSTSGCATACARRITVSVEWLSIQVRVEHTVWAAGSQPVAVPDTRQSIVLSRPLCPQRKCQVVLNQEDLLVTTANDQTAWHRCHGRMIVVLYGASLNCPDTLAALSYLDKAV